MPSRDPAVRLRNSLQHLISDKEATRRDNARLLRAMKYGFKPRSSIKVRMARYKIRRARHPFKAGGSYSRYRELPLSGYERTIRAGVTVLGTFKRRINNVVDTTQVQKATGDRFEELQLVRTWDQVNPGPPYNAGGPFRSVAYRVPSSELKGGGKYVSSQFLGLQPRSDWEYIGKFSCGQNWATDVLSTYVDSGWSSFSSLSGFHSKAWDSLKPKVSTAGLAQFVYELRDLPGQLKTSSHLFSDLWKEFYGRKHRDIITPHRAADNFLNHHFGWVPFISDLVKLYEAYSLSEQIIIQSIKNNGRWMKRSRVLENVDSLTPLLRLYGSDTEPSDGTFPMAQMVGSMTVDGIPCKGLTDIHLHDSHRVWAVGSFKYYRPEFDDSLEDFSSLTTTIQRTLTRYGARINPVVLYKITPWTWLIDWFTKFGDFVERLNDFVDDGIVSRYLYVMKQSDRTVIKTCMINFSGSGPLTLRWERKLSTKQREVADSPYGFNVPWSGLSAKQLAILAAVGFTNLGSGFIARG